VSLAPPDCTANDPSEIFSGARWRAQHSLEIVLAYRDVEFKITCGADPGANCRLTCPHGCEELVVERADGIAFHVPYRDEIDLDGSEERHLLEAVDYCNFAEWLNAEPRELLEAMAPQAESPLIAELPIEVSWDPSDGPAWRLAESDVADA